MLATGRDMDNRYSEGLKELIRPDAIVHLNGTKVTVGEQVIFEHFFSKEKMCIRDRFIVLSYERRNERERYLQGKFRQNIKIVLKVGKFI